MFDIGIQELVVVFLVALLVFGPQRLPELGRALGKFIFELKKGINDARFQLEGEFKELERRSAVQASQPEKEESLPGSAAPSGEDKGEREGDA
jgi:Tat protein translocase TatB subunit